MVKISKRLVAAAFSLIALAGSGLAFSQVSSNVVRIGFITDMSGDCLSYPSAKF